jgi:GDP-L-fucose synthase
MNLLKEHCIYVGGHNGMVGRSVVRTLRNNGYDNLLLVGSDEVDLRDSRTVHRLFSKNDIDWVVLCAAKVGGIGANSNYKGDFIRDNLLIQTNVIDGAKNAHCKGLVFLGSSCIYPKLCDQPIREEYLLTGSLENTNDAYAIAKIAGVKMCESYYEQFGLPSICLMPTNLYGPWDNYHPVNSHVMASLIRKVHRAKVEGHKTVAIWGSGKPKREFLHVDDLGSCILHVMQNVKFDSSLYNVGTGVDISVLELTRLIGEVIGWDGYVILDETQPDGTPRKLLDISKIQKTGWNPAITLKEGIQNTYKSYLQGFGKNI